MDAFLDLLNLQVPQAHLAGFALYAALAGMGLGIGMLTGLFGVGGAFLVVPLLNTLLGIPYELAIGSSLCFVAGTSTAGLIRHARLGNVELAAAVFLSAGSMVGAVLGDMLQDVLVRHVAGGDQARFDTLMDVLFVGLLCVVILSVVREPRPHASGKVALQRMSLGPRVDLRKAGREGVSGTGLVAIGLLVGVMTGVFGVGGGVLFVPILLIFVGMSPHLAVGTSLGVVLLASTAGTVKKGLADEVSLTIAMALLLGSVLGVQAGVWLCGRIGGKQLRRYFALVVAAAVVMLLVDLARGML
jgi:hypothetical protein